MGLRLLFSLWFLLLPASLGLIAGCTPGKAPQHPTFRQIFQVRDTIRIEVTDSSMVTPSPWDFVCRWGSRRKIVITDCHKNAVFVYDSTGRFWHRIGRLGRGPGEFITPWNAASCSNGSLCVYDKQLNRVQFFDSLGRFVKAITPAEGMVDDLAYRRTDMVALVKHTSGGSETTASIIRIDATGSATIAHLDAYLKSPKLSRWWSSRGDVAVDEAGNIFVIESANFNILKFSPDGAFLARSTEVPAHYVAGPDDSGWFLREYTKKELSVEVSLSRGGYFWNGFLFVYSSCVKARRTWCDVFDSDLRMVATGIEIPEAFSDLPRRDGEGISLLTFARGDSAGAGVPASPLLIRYIVNTNVLER
jgi:hypothetical protein